MTQQWPPFVEQDWSHASRSLMLVKSTVDKCCLRALAKESHHPMSQFFRFPCAILIAIQQSCFLILLFILLFSDLFSPHHFHACSSLFPFFFILLPPLYLVVVLLSCLFMMSLPFLYFLLSSLFLIHGSLSRDWWAQLCTCTAAPPHCLWRVASLVSWSDRPHTGESQPVSRLAEMCFWG